MSQHGGDPRAPAPAVPAGTMMRRVDTALGACAATVLMALMAMTFTDVVLRYLFGRPLSGAFELTELAMLVLIFAGLPLVSSADEHVTMDFIDRLLGPNGRRWLARATQAVTAAAMLLLAWLIWVKAGKVSAYGDTTDVLGILVGPFVYFMALATGASALIHLAKAVVRQ